MVFVFILSCSVIVEADVKQKDTALWHALKNGSHIAMLRHALAPGFGDPDYFEVDDCSTQRNLSDEGRNQARLIGQRFRDKGISNAAVFSSQWCRCLETARLLRLGQVGPLPALNSFFQRNERSQAQTQNLQQWLNNQKLSGVTILVTHQVNIRALTGISPRSGEMVIFHLNNQDEVEVLGTIMTQVQSIKS